MQQSPSSSSRITLVLGCMLFVGALIFYFGPVLRMEEDGEALHAVSPVKILNPNLSDEELSQLDKSKFNYLAMIDAGTAPVYHATTPHCAEEYVRDYLAQYCAQY